MYGASILLSFFLGGLVVLRDLPPAETIRQTTLLTNALLAEALTKLHLIDHSAGGRWTKAHHSADPQGPTLAHEPGKAQPGLNLVVSGHSPEAFLMTMDGTTVHRWHVPFADLWQDPPHIDRPKSSSVYWPRAYLYPNGDILAVCHGFGDTPYGYGLIKIDRNSQVIWKTPANIHHDVDVGADGSIYTLSQEIQQADEPGVASLKAPFIAESVLILTPEGEISKKISLVEALKRSNYAPILDSMQPDLHGDVIHVNSIQVIDQERAIEAPFEPGHLLISMRNVDTIAVLDPDTATITWAMTGMWRGQHHPRLLDNGNILVFDNQGNFGDGGASRVLEFDPATQEVAWSFTGNEQELFYSELWGAQQRLANGNTLIIESMNGRAFEVTGEGEIVWEYRSPIRIGENDEFVLVLPDLKRVDPDRLTFLDDDRLRLAREDGMAGSHRSGQ